MEWKLIFFFFLEEEKTFLTFFESLESVFGICLQNLPLVSLPLFRSPSFTASAFVSIYSCHPHTHPSLSLSILLFLYVISSFLTIIPVLPTLTRSHLFNLHVVTLNSILTFFAKAPFCSTSRHWRVYFFLASLLPVHYSLVYIVPLYSLSLVINFFFLLSIHLSTHYSLLTRFVGWLMLKMFASVFDSIQVNLNHLSALHRVSQEVQVSMNTRIHMQTICPNLFI